MREPPDQPDRLLGRILGPCPVAGNRNRRRAAILKRPRKMLAAARNPTGAFPPKVALAPSTKNWEDFGEIQSASSRPCCDCNSCQTSWKCQSRNAPLLSALTHDAIAVASE